MEEKLRFCFPDMVVKKSPERTKIFTDLKLPSYMRDWIVMKFADENGDIDREEIAEYVHRYIPNRESWKGLLHDLTRGITVKILAKVRVKTDIASGETLFMLPDFSFPKREREAVVERYVADQNKKNLFEESESWGIIELEWRNEDLYNDRSGRVYMIGFKPFCPYHVDLDFFQEARKEFTTKEWLDVVLSAVDYNPNGFLLELNKCTFLRRLIPFVEKRTNLIELAPKGTGKSYLFSQISKNGWLISGGSITRAKLFFDIARKTEGIIFHYDYVAFDEIQSIRFSNPEEIQGALKGYLESDTGEYRIGDHHGNGEAGLVLLGNISHNRMNIDTNMFEELPKIFHESALLDRFNGFIQGWNIPRMKENMKADCWALNTEYFAEIMHKMRQDIVYSAIIDEVLEVPKGADTRDTRSIKRICSGLLKLIFPHVRDGKDIIEEEFVKYCLEPAKEMRGIIKKQLSIIDPGEYRPVVPDISFRR
jgi:ATP-dependent Lon protease